MTAAFSERVLAWYEAHGRKDLPWQQSPTPYRVWVSEIMLQQTQVKTVIPFFKRFNNRFPEIHSLSTASLDEVLELWSGLGYYARARNLHKAAQVIVHDHAGVFPGTLEDAIKLPGIGRSTAGAILSLALNQRHPILDGNVKRVLTRHSGIRGWPGESKVQRLLWQLTDEHTPAEPSPKYTQAMMDLGATVCKRGKPACSDCPVSKDCTARLTGQQNILPLSRPRKDYPTKHTVMLIIQNRQGEILLERRPTAGIWGGLLCFPEIGSIDHLKLWCQQKFGIQAQTSLVWTPMVHKFSHFQLIIKPVQINIIKSSFAIRESENYIWCRPESPGGGLPTPVDYLIEQLIFKQAGVKNVTHG